MANCQKHFLEFDGEIKLTATRVKSLKASRKELRRKIREYFKAEKPDKIQPKFAGQGSLLMGTIINPLLRYQKVNGQEVKILYYDVDDGIYFIGDQNPEDRDSVEDYHSWVIEAVDGHTNSPAIDKDTCVRTLFADGHNIDNPIYYQQGKIPELAHKKNGWIESDPRAFSEWFLNLVSQYPQLQKIVRCLKAWADKMDFDNPQKEMPPGIVLTILAANHAHYYGDRLDIALKETLINIEAALSLNFSCLRPTTPSGDNLLDGYKYQNYFMEKIRGFIADAKNALKEANEQEATKFWRKNLSNRFPLGEDIIQENSTTIPLASIGLNKRPFLS